MTSLEILVAEIENCYKQDARWTEKQVQVGINLFQNAFKRDEKSLNKTDSIGGYDTGLPADYNNNPM